MTTQMLMLNHQTRLAVSVIIEDDTRVLAYSILFVTSLFTYLRKVSQFVRAIKRGGSLLVIDVKAAFDFTAKVFVIGFNSLAYGLGVTL